MIGFKAVSLAVFDRYISMIRKYHTTIGDSTRRLIYQCDVRCRQELIPLILCETNEKLAAIREAAASSASAEGPALPARTAEGISRAISIPGFDAESSWDCCVLQATQSADWWKISSRGQQKPSCCTW